jgi:hypothetical protein
VSASSRASQRKACARWLPHISGDGWSDAHTGGRTGSPNSAQRSSAVSCTQRMPAGLLDGMPGIGELIEGAMQQAAQAVRQCIRGIVCEGVPLIEPAGNTVPA